MAADFSAIFARLREMLVGYEPHMLVAQDTPDTYYLNTPLMAPDNTPLFFGAAAVKKNYVSYYLMPVYMNPALLDGISDDLKRRMQGKSCFNFKRADEALFEELAALTRAAFEWLDREHLSRAGDANP